MNYHQDRLSVYSQSNIQTITDIQCHYPQTIKELQVTHCNLHSLEGIQQYTNLQILNIKYNNIQDPLELTRIADCNKIKELNIQGNPIEYLAMCMFVSLRQNGFEGLVVFNNRDYSRWKDRRRGRDKQRGKENIKKIYSKADRMYRDMKETLKNSVKANIMGEYRAVCEDESEQSDTYRTTQINPSSCRKKYSYQDYLSQQKNSTKEVSLQNANFIKSMPGQQNYPINEIYKQKTQKNFKKMPQPYTINEINFDTQEAPNVLQPTATFASQKMKDTTPFRSKNNHKKSFIGIYLDDDEPGTEYYTEDNEQSESEQSYSEQYYESDYDSFSQRPGGSRVSYNYMPGNSRLSNMTSVMQDKQEQCVKAYYIKNLYMKIFRILKSQISCDMPLKSKQYCY